MGPNILLRWSWLNMRTIGLLRQLAGGVEISTPCGEVSCVDGFRYWHVALSCPGGAYFVYKSCPSRDQTKLT